MFFKLFSLAPIIWMKFSDTLLVFGTDICNFSDKYLDVKESDSYISL